MNQSPEDQAPSRNQGRIVRANTIVEIDHKRLARLLKAFRSRSKWSRDDVEQKLTMVLTSSDTSISDLDRQVFSKGAAFLESSRDAGEIKLSIGALQEIANGYKIPRLMLDPLLSTASDSPCVIGDFDKLIEIAIENADYLGVRVKYRVPQTCLADTDEVALVCLDLERGGHSDTHAHPGSELLFVLEGRIEVRLDSCGLWTPLEEGDYIHFYSEERHSAWNLSDASARVLVIRFYQLEISGSSPGSRSQFLKDLKALGSERAKRPAILISRLVEEISPTLDLSRDRQAEQLEMSSDAPKEQEVVDRFGLARLLRHICSPGFRGEPLSLQDLANRATNRGLPFNRSRIDRLQNGLAPLKSDELPQLADLYMVKPFLFYNFLYPSVRHAIAVRAGASRNAPSPRPDKCAERSDFSSVPAEFVGEDGVHIEVPRRRLTDSDIAIVLVELDPNRSTPVNRHPGHELILLLEGAIEIRFGEMSQKLASPKRSYAHYLARFDHCIANPHSVKAKFLVIRFHE